MVLKRIVVAACLLAGVSVAAPVPATAWSRPCVLQADLAFSPGLAAAIDYGTGVTFTGDVTLTGCEDPRASFAKSSLVNGTAFGTCADLTGSGLAAAIGSAPFSFHKVGEAVAFDGAFVGVGHITENAGSDCLLGGARRFTVTAVGSAAASDAPVIPGGGAATNSSWCTAAPVHEGTTLGTYFKVQAQQDLGATTVCWRIDNGSTVRLGGRFVIAPPRLGRLPSAPSLPSTDANSTACQTTTPNAAPGPHPLDEGATGGVFHRVDTWSGPDAAWVCLQVGGTQVRVKVSTAVDAGSLPTPPWVFWMPDAGTPG